MRPGDDSDKLSEVYHEKSFILPDVSRVLACLYEKDVKFETHTASYKSLLRLQASSHAPVPFYDGPTFLEESREICRYIAEKYEHQGYPFLLGKDALERASIEQWLHNEEHAFNPPSRALFCHLAFPLGEEDDNIDIHTRKLEEVLEVYEQRLSDSEFLVGNKFTLADLVHLPNSHYIKASNKFLYLYDSRKNVRRWWDAISDRDSWKIVLRYMEWVEEQNKQELKKQQQQQQEEDPRTSADSSRPRKQIRTEPRTILVPPTDTRSSSSIVPRTKKRLPGYTSPDELLISSSHSTPADKTSAVQSQETTIYTNPQETPPTSVQSTPVTSKKLTTPVQSTKHATSPTTAKKPPITDAVKPSTKDDSILESNSSRDVSSDLDVFDHYPSHTDVDTPYIEPTTRKTSETFGAFPGSDIGTDYSKTSFISARKEADQPTASDFYKSGSTGASFDSQFKESVSFSGRTPPELEPTDTSASKLHTTDVHRRLQVEQWHSAKTGLNDLKHDDADHLVSTQQGKPRKDVQQYPSQDSEQATSHSVPQEPMSRDVLSQVEDYASSDQRGALLPPSTQEHGVTPSRQAGPKDAGRKISSQTAYPGGQDTSKQPRDHGSVQRQREPQDAREIFDESQVPDSTISSERFPYTSQLSLPRQDLDGTRHATAPFETRYPRAEDTSKQAKDKISIPLQTTDHDAGDVNEETKVSESSSLQVRPSYFERADAPSWKQETIDDTFKETRYHIVAPPSQTRYQTPPSKARYPTAEDASKQPRGTAPAPKKKAAQDDNDTSEESNTADEVASTQQPLDAWRSPVSPRRQNVEDSSRSDTSFQKRNPYDEEDIQVANTASVSWQIAPDGEKNIFEETKLPASTPTSAKPVYTPRTPFPPSRQAEVKDAKDKGRQSRVTIPESQKIVSGDSQTTHGERKTGAPGEQSSDHLQAIPQSRPPAAKGLSTREEITNEQTVVPPLLSNELTSQVQPASESLQEVASPGVLSTKPSTIEQWQRATVPLNDITSSSDDGEIVAETPGVQSASPPFPGASTAHHATSDDKMLPTPYSAPAHTKRESPDGREIVDSELVSTPGRHISEAAKIRQDQAIVHEDVHGANLSAHDAAKGTFKEAKVAESTPSSAKPMYSQQPAPTPRHAEVEDTWDKGMKGREPISDRQQMLEKWAGTAGEQASDSRKASAASRQAAAEDVRGATGDIIQSPHVLDLDTSKKSRGAYEEAKGPGSVKEEKTSIYQKKPLVAQSSQEQAQTIPAGEKAEHQQASDAPNTFVEKLNASEPARVKTHGESAEQTYKKDTTDDQKVAPPLSTRELTSHVQPPSEPSYDAALHRDLSSKPSTIYQWQHSSAPLHGVTSSSGDDEVAKSTVDEKPTPVTQQKIDEKRVEPSVPIEAEISGVQHASPSFPGASVDDRATIGDKFAKRSIIDERVGEPTQRQTSSQDAHPSSEPTKRDTKVVDYIPSRDQPMHIQQPALTPSRQIQVEEARDKSMQSRETIPEQQNMVERKTGISGEQLSDRQKEIHPSRKPSAEDATIQSPDILDTPKKSRATFEESIGSESTLSKGQGVDTQDSQLRKGEPTVPTTDQRKDWKYAKHDESIMTEENSLSTKRLRKMFQESTSTAPKTQPTSSEGSNALEKTSSVYHKDPLAAQDILEEAQAIPADEKVYGSTSEHHESFGDPFTYDKNLSVSAPARADIHDGHHAEEQYKKYTADDQKVAPSLSSKEPESQVQPASETLQRAVPDGDLPSQSFTIDQWQRTAAPLHGVIIDSGDDGAAMSSNNDQRSTSMSQEATPSSQSVNQMGKQSDEQKVETPVPIVAEASDVGRAASSLPEAARDDVATMSDKFTEQSKIDERTGKPKQMQTPNTAAHPASAHTMRTPVSHEAGELFRTPEGQRLEAAKVTQDPATIHEDVYDASLPTHNAAIDEKTATAHASGDEVVTGSLHDQSLRPASIQVQPTIETPHDSDSFQYVHSGDSGKAELAKPTVTDQEATVPAAGPTSADPQDADMVPAGVAHSEQKYTPSDKGSARAAQHPSPVEPIKADSNVSAANYTNAPQMIFRQQARPPAPSTIGVRTSDTQGVIGKIQEVTPDNSRSDDSGKPFVPNQEYVSHASEAIPGQVEMTSPQGARVFPMSDTQLSSADVHEVTPDDQQIVESVTPLVSSGKQGSLVRPFKPGEVGPAEKKIAPSDEESPHSSEESISGEPRKEQTVFPTAEQTMAQPTIIDRQDIPERKQALTSEDTLNNTATPDDVHHAGTIEPARRPLSVEGEELTSATQAPSPSVAKDSFHTELEPSATPDADDITPSSAPGEAAHAEQKSASSGQGSADPAQPSLGLRNEEIRDSSPSAMLISSSDSSKGDPMIAVRDQAKDSQTSPGQDILYTEHPSGKIQENVPSDKLGKAEPSRPSSTIQEGKPSKAPALSIQLGSVPNELSVDEQKLAPPGQDSAYLARPPSSAEPRSKEIGDLAPFTQLNSTTDPRNKDSIVAAPDQTMDSQTTPSRQVKFSAPSSQGPLGKLQEDDTADDSGETKSSKPPSVVQEGKPATAVPISSLDTQHGAAPDQDAVGQKFSPSALDTQHGVAPDLARPPSSAEPREEDMDAATADQTSVPPSNVTRQDISSTPDASDALSRDQESIADNGHIRNLESPLLASQEESSHPGRASEGSTPKEDSAIVDGKRTLPSSQAQTSSTGPDSAQIGSDARPSGAGMPATSSREKQEAEPPAATQAPTSKGLQDSGNMESPRQASTDQTVTPAMNSTAPSIAPEGTEPGPNSSRSVQTPFSTEPTKEDTIVPEVDQAEDMQAVTHQQAITPAPDTAKPPFPGAQDASRKFQESIADDAPVEDYSPKPAAQPQAPAATLDVSPPYALSQAKSTRQGAKPPTGYQASSPETQLGSSQIQGEAAPAEQKFSLSDEKFVDASKSFASAEPREEDMDATTADQTWVPPPNVTRQVISSTPDASDALSRDQESIADNGHIRNLESPLLASQESSRAGHASEGSTPKEHSAIVDEKRTLPSSQAQTSSTGPDSAQIDGDARPSGAGMPAKRSMEKQEAKPPAATQAPTSKGLQDYGNMESPRQASTDQTVTPAMNSAAPSIAPEGTEPGPNSSRSVQTPFSTEPTKEDTIVAAADQAEDMQTLTHQQGITPAPDTAKPPFPGAQDASRKFLESITDDAPVEDYSPKPAAQQQPRAATLDASPPYASSQAKSTGQGAKPPTGYQASSPETQLGSSQIRGEAAPAEQKFALSDEKSVDASKSFASTEPREEDTDGATADQTSVPPPNVDNGQIRNLESPLIASQEESSRAGRASEGSPPKEHSAIVDGKRTLPSSQAQTSSTGPDSAQIGGGARPSGAGMPATRSTKKQEAEPPAATQAPTSKGLQDSGNMESPRQASTDQTVTPAMNSAAPSIAPEATEPDPNSSRSVQTPFSTEPTEEDTIVAAADRAEDMQTVTHQQAITPAPDTAKPSFSGAQDASRKFQESITEDAPVKDYSPKPAAQPQAPAATLDVSPPYALSQAKSTGQGAKPPTGYQASSPETQLGSSQIRGEAAPAVQKFALSDEKSVDASKSFASAEPMEDDMDVATADQTSVPPPNIDDGQIRNLESPLIASQEEFSRAGRASEGSTPKEDSAIVDGKRTLPSSQAQTSSTGSDSAQIGGDARPSGAGMPATRSTEKQEAEPPAATQAPTSKGLQDSGNMESPRQASTDQTVTPGMNSAASSVAPEGTEPGPNSSRSVQAPFSAEPTEENTIVAAADRAEDMQTVTHQQAITPAPDTTKPSFSGAQVASRKFQESTHDDGYIDELPRGSSSKPREGQTFGPYQTNVDEKTDTFPSSQANISESGSDFARTLAGVVPSIGEGPAENYSPMPGAQTQLPAASADVSSDASSKSKSTDQAGKAPTGYLASSPDTQLGSSQTQGEAAPAEEKLPVSGMRPIQPSKGAPFDVFSNEKTTMTQDQVNTLSNGDLSSNQIVEQPESVDSKGVNSGRNLKGASTNEESKSQQQVDQFGTQSFKDNNKEADGTVRSNISRALEELQEPPSRPKRESSEEPENQQLADQAIVKPLEGNEKQAEQTKPHETETAELENIEDPENTNLKNNRISQVETLDQSGKQQLGKTTKDAPNSTEDAPSDGKVVNKSEHSSRSSEESRVQLQSEENTQGRGTDAPSLETGHPSNRGLPANSYQNNSIQSQAEASNKSIEQSSPGVRNKDNDSSRLDDSTDPTKPET